MESLLEGQARRQPGRQAEKRRGEETRSVKATGRWEARAAGERGVGQAWLQLAGVEEVGYAQLHLRCPGERPLLATHPVLSLMPLVLDELQCFGCTQTESRC